MFVNVCVCTILLKKGNVYIETCLCEDHKKDAKVLKYC